MSHQYENFHIGIEMYLQRMAVRDIEIVPTLRKAANILSIALVPDFAALELHPNCMPWWITFL